MKRQFCLILLSFALLASSHAQYYAEKLEPKSGILWGAGQSDMFTRTNDYFQPYNDFAKAVGFTPTIAMDYVPLGLSLSEIRGRFAEIRAALKPGIKLNIGITFTGAGLLNATKNLIPDIIGGKYDANFVEIGKQLNSLNTDCFIRLGHEFDLKSLGYLGGDYKKAFARGAGLLRQQASRIALVWCSAGGSGGRWGDTLQLLKSYPGDSLVNWMGADVFDASEWGGKAMANFMGFAKAHKKPLMIGETTPRGVGVLDGKKSWDKWFAPAFKTIAANPTIKAVCYINWDWAAENKTRFNPGWGNWGDARLQQNSYVAAAFAASIKAMQLPVVYDTTWQRVVYPLIIHTCHDSTIYKDSLRIVDIKELK